MIEETDKPKVTSLVTPEDTKIDIQKGRESRLGIGQLTKPNLIQLHIEFTKHAQQTISNSDITSHSDLTQAET